MWLVLAIAVTALLYVRGWFRIRKTRPKQFNGWRLISFLLGLAILWLALSPPMDELADVLLSAHMVEHLLLMSAVPPLLLLGLPVVPLLRGVPAPLLKSAIGPLLRWRSLRHFMRLLVTPVVAWLAMNIAFLGWHVPAAYDFALNHEHWHELEHVCFLGTSLLFWWCIFQPWPATRHGYSWVLLFYLVAADAVNTVLSAFLAFCGRPVYTYYLSRPNPFQISPLSDQILGAAIMWVAGSLVFLVPAIGITFDLLNAGARRTE